MLHNNPLENAVENNNKPIADGMALSSNPQYHQKQANIYLFTHLEVS
jgi:hypothetical protein